MCSDPSPTGKGNPNGRKMKIRQTIAGDASQPKTRLGRSDPTVMATAYEKVGLIVALLLTTKAKLDLLTSKALYLVEQAGDVRGCGGWTFGEPDSGRISEGLAHLSHFAIDPGARGRVSAA
ncbi:hypothetical protein [Ensifer sp. B1-9]|uniref:hypothetical protein n=1 Tax=Ensifer sp. B1-9 TaxID=3141455 RepID=UPI003D1C5309